MIRWLEKAQIYKDSRLLAILCLSFTSGVPFLLTLSTLSFWLTEEGISKTALGLFMLVSLPYSFKVLWAPLLDHVQLPFIGVRLGQRRSWLLFSQMMLIVSLVALAQSRPHEALLPMAGWALLVSFFSATQDIVIDGYRIEILNDFLSGPGAALETIGFRFGMLASGAGALYLADRFNWQVAYEIMAFFVLVGVITVLCMPEPKGKNKKKPMLSLKAWFLDPLVAFRRQENLLYLLAFILLFKMADTVLNAMSAPFLFDLGFTKIEFAQVSKIFGILLMVLGGLVGGIFIHQLGIIQTLAMTAILQAVACLMFAIQAIVGHHMVVLMITVGVESFCSGLTHASFIAYLSSFCKKPHTATHFTFLYSFGSLCRVATSAAAGWMADQVGWVVLFSLCAGTVIPILWLLGQDTRYHHKNSRVSIVKKVA